jgi:hypothetical protein
MLGRRANVKNRERRTKLLGSQEGICSVQQSWCHNGWSHLRELDRVIQEEELPPEIKDKMTMLTIHLDPKFKENSQWVKRWIRHWKVATNRARGGVQNNLTNSLNLTFFQIIVLLKPNKSSNLLFLLLKFTLIILFLYNCYYLTT